MACDDLAANLAKLQNQKNTILQNIQSQPTQSEQQAARNGAQKQLTALSNQIQAASDALQACLDALIPKKLPGAQPASILSVANQNPFFSDSDDWGTRIAGGTFPFSQGFEWKQVMDPSNEYDSPSISVSGWAVYHDVALEDFQCLHPFGNDWEFSCVVDAPFLYLLSNGGVQLLSINNLTPAIVRTYLTSLTIPENVIVNTLAKGFLGVELDNGLVPRDFQDGFSDGDRVAVVGRWVIDCGHDDYHTEIHPPLLMASAAIYKDPTTQQEFTRALFTSRPYLVGQTFANGTNTTQIYDDSSGDDGHFLEHLGKEIAKAESIVLSTQVDAHPKIKQFPFRGANSFEFVVGNPNPSSAHLINHLVVSFHFSVRSGCVVEVMPNDASSVKVLVTLNSAGYTPPPLPKRNDQQVSLDQFKTSLTEKLGEDAIEVLNTFLNPAGAYILSKGLITDLYDPILSLPIQIPSPDTVTNAPANAIPPGKGFTVNNDQQHPLLGWVEIGWVPSTVQVKL